MSVRTHILCLSFVWVCLCSLYNSKREHGYNKLRSGSFKFRPLPNLLDWFFFFLFPLFYLEIFSSSLEKAKFIGMTILCQRGLLPCFIFCSFNSLMLSFLQQNSLLRWSGTRLKGNTSHKDIKPVVSSRTFIYFLC